MHAKSTLHDPVDYILSDSSAHEILQARILEWAAIYLYIYAIYIYMYVYIHFKKALYTYIYIHGLPKWL